MGKRNSSGTHTHTLKIFDCLQLFRNLVWVRQGFLSGTKEGDIPLSRSLCTPIDIFALMYPEADTMFRTMLQLKRAYEIPSLTVRDSIIVLERGACAAAGAMTRNFMSVCGVKTEFGNWERPAGMSA